MLLAKRSLIVGAATVTSRLTGFARDVLVAALLGTGPAAEAFLVAFRLPNLFRRVLGEGALNAGFVPVYLRLRLTKGVGEARSFAGICLALTALAASAATILLIFGASLLVDLLAPGFSSDPDKAALAVDYTRAALPFLALALVASLVSAVLVAQEHFLLAVSAPVLVNLLLAGLAWWLQIHPVADAVAAWWMAFGLTLSGLVQLALVAAALVLLRERPLWPGLSAVRRAGPLLVGSWLAGLQGLVAVGASQVAILAGAIVASGTPSAVAHLYYAERVFQLPLGFVGVATATVLLPLLTRSRLEAKPAGAQAALSKGGELALHLTLPAALALLALAEPITRVLFQHGAFAEKDVGETARTLQALALGLPAGVLAKLWTQALFAEENTRVPVRAALLGLCVTILAALVLVGSLRAAGIALAVSLGAVAMLADLGLALRKRGWKLIDPGFARRLPLAFAIAVLMSAGVWELSQLAAPWLSEPVRLDLRLAVLGLICLSGILLYGGAAHLTKAADWRRLFGPDDVASASIPSSR